ALPVEAILATPVAAPSARVRIRLGRRMHTFRVPCMRDIAAARREGGDLARAVLARCRIGDRAVPHGAAARLAPKFEALDPAANIVMHIACAGCARPIAATVDLAGFVARDLDRLADGL